MKVSDFDAAFSDGTTVEPWNDPASGGIPSRQNAFPDHPHLRHVAETGSPVEVTATVGGVAAPMDAALGGRLFSFYVVEWPLEGTSPPPATTGAAAQSSVQTFTPPAAGHYTLKMKRPEGGSIYLHVDAVDP